MSEEAASSLPSGTTQVELEGKTVYIVGTAHVSLESVEDVRRTVEIVRPDAICVELCPARHQAMTRRLTRLAGGLPN